ncbi:MAG: CRISPR-associated endonuclease Cas1 [Anaerolineae bacterium]|nr:CRISPR-associated endonuclease Cas1 [Anaerolineae bacterium]MDW8300536.1 CRISPR-associated endonuclease Cas1 [Anaerolineae bacterium]
MPIVTHLIADAFGTYIGKHSERLQLVKNNQVLQEAPLVHLQMVLITSLGVSISADAVAECCERGIPIFFLDGEGTAYGALYSAGLTGTIETRRAQLRAHDTWRGRHVALAFASAKLHSQANTLRYMAKNHRQSNPERYERLNNAALSIFELLARLESLDTGDQTADDVRPTILALEGSAAKFYWEAVRGVIPSEYGWTKREGRGARDAVNSLLNYAYGILYGQIERAIVLAGLDPYAGFIHTDRPGKPSLVLDFIEEFRAFTVDRVVFGLLNRHFKVKQEEDGLLSEETRRALAEHILMCLESGVRYEGKSYPLRTLIQMQARQLATFLRGESERYQPFKSAW